MSIHTCVCAVLHRLGDPNGEVQHCAVLASNYDILYYTIL